MQSESGFTPSNLTSNLGKVRPMSNPENKQGRQRGQMPICAAFIDDMRSAFGADDINRQQARGMRGEPTFWASEGGNEIGTRPEVGREFAAAAQLPGVVPIKGHRQ